MSGFDRPRHVPGSLAPAFLLLAALLGGCAGRGGGRIGREDRAPPPAPLLSDGSARAEPAGPLSVIQAVAAALEGNPDLRAAAERIAQAEIGLSEAKAAFLPGLSADFAYLRADAPSAYLFKTIDARSYVPGTDFNDPGAFNNWELGGTLTWNLFRGGADLLAHRIAETEEALSRLDRSALENRLIAAVIHGYYDLLAAAEFIETAEASIRTVRAQLDDIRKLYEGGATGARKADVLALEVREAEACERELRARNAHTLAVAVFNNLLGRAPERPLELSGDEWNPRPLPAKYEEAVAEAAERRPELATARATVERAELAHDAERTAFLPRVDLMGRTYWDDADARYRRDTLNWTLGVALSWDIFRGGARFARVRRARARIAELRALDAKATLAVELDVRTAFVRTGEAKARLEVARRAVAQAEQSLELASSLYRGGAATVTRYLEAEFALTAARVRLTQAQYDRKKSSADLARAMGWCIECVRKELGNR